MKEITGGGEFGHRNVGVRAADERLHLRVELSAFAEIGHFLGIGEAFAQALHPLVKAR